MDVSHTNIWAGKESTCNAGDWVWSLGWEGKGYPLQYSGLENSMDCTVHGAAETWLRDFHFSGFPNSKGPSNLKRGEDGSTARGRCLRPLSCQDPRVGWGSPEPTLPQGRPRAHWCCRELAPASAQGAGPESESSVLLCGAPPRRHAATYAPSSTRDVKLCSGIWRHWALTTVATATRPPGRYLLRASSPWDPPCAGSSLYIRVP